MLPVAHYPISFMQILIYFPGNLTLLGVLFQVAVLLFSVDQQRTDHSLKLFDSHRFFFLTCFKNLFYLFILVMVVTCAKGVGGKIIMIFLSLLGCDLFGIDVVLPYLLRPCLHCYQLTIIFIYKRDQEVPISANITSI